MQILSLYKNLYCTKTCFTHLWHACFKILAGILHSTSVWSFPYNLQLQELFVCEIIWAYFLFTSFSQSVQSLSRVHLFATPWTAAHQASRSITNSRSLLKLMSIESVMPSNHLSPVIPFSSCLQSFPALGSFPMSQFFTKMAKVLELQLQQRSF